MTDLWNTKVTIYNDVPKRLLTERHFNRFVIDKCQVQGQFVEKVNNTIQNIVNAKTVITKDFEHFKNNAEYDSLGVDEQTNYYTARVGDFLVFDEVEDVITTNQEFQELQKKYVNNGMKITTISISRNGFKVDNITFTNA